jgi:NAD(P)-dependent dehydrogenase (short-subunit alcohol dehydrogenase family)
MIGAAKGVGLSVARKLAGDGAHKVITDVLSQTTSSFIGMKNDYPGNNRFGPQMSVIQRNKINTIVEEMIKKSGKSRYLV